jgi:hypothetical protein
MKSKLSVLEDRVTVLEDMVRRLLLEKEEINKDLREVQDLQAITLTIRDSNWGSAVLVHRWIELSLIAAQVKVLQQRTLSRQVYNISADIISTLADLAKIHQSGYVHGLSMSCKNPSDYRIICNTWEERVEKLQKMMEE